MSKCGICGNEGCTAPSENEIEWNVTPDSLMAIAEKYWDALLPALKQLEAEYQGNVALDPAEAARRVRQAKVEDIS